MPAEMGMMRRSCFRRSFFSASLMGPAWDGGMSLKLEVSFDGLYDIEVDLHL